MVYSHHSHSGQFCHHGADTLELVVAQAARRGFKMYSLTEHCPRYRDSDLYPEEIEVYSLLYVIDCALIDHQ